MSSEHLCVLPELMVDVHKAELFKIRSGYDLPSLVAVTEKEAYMQLQTWDEKWARRTSCRFLFHLVKGYQKGCLILTTPDLGLGPRARTGEHVPGVVGTFGGEGRTHLSLMASGGAKRILTENTAARETRFLGALVGRSTRFSNGAPRSPKANPQKMKRIGLMNAPFFSIGVLRSPEGSPPKVNLIGLTNATLQIHLSPKRVPAKTVPFGFRFNVQEHMEAKRESQLVFEFHVNLQGGSCILRSPNFDFAGCRVPLERWSVLLEAGIAWQGTEDVVRRASSCSLHASGNG